MLCKRKMFLGNWWEYKLRLQPSVISDQITDKNLQCANYNLQLNS